MRTDEVIAWLQDAAEQAKSPVAAAPRTRWEHRWRAQLLVFVVLVAVAAPLLPGLLEPAAGEGLHALAWLTATPLRRQVTGFGGLAVIAFQLSHALRRRRQAQISGSRAGWSTAHKLAALALLPIVLLHTGGRAGVGANHLLLAVLLALVLVAQAGHVMKALAHDRVHAEGRCPTAPMRRFEHQANAEEGVVHSAGHLLHVALATAATFLLALHVFCVYYF